MAVTTPLVLAFGAASGAVLSPLALLASQWMTRTGQARHQQAEHEEARRVRERQFEEERRSRLHDARIEAHAAMVRLCDELPDVRYPGPDSDDTRALDHTQQTRQQAATVGIYSSPPVADLAVELFRSADNLQSANEHGYVQFGDPEDPTVLNRHEAWAEYAKRRAKYVVAFQAELGIVQPAQPPTT